MIEMRPGQPRVRMLTVLELAGLLLVGAVLVTSLAGIALGASCMLGWL